MEWLIPFCPESATTRLCEFKFLVKFGEFFLNGFIFRSKTGFFFGKLAVWRCHPIGFSIPGPVALSRSRSSL